MPDEPMPRRDRSPDRDGVPPSEERGEQKPWPPDDLMSQFDAIERLLRTRRDAERERQAAPDEASTDQAESLSARAAEEQPAAAVSEPVAALGTSRGADRAEADGEREPDARSRRNVILTVCGVVAAALTMAATAWAMTSNPHSATQRPPAHPSPTPDEIQAAQWVADHIGPDHVVACDVDLCALARQFGASAAALVTVGSDITQVERADVVISTSIVRGDFGVQLAAISSPEPLASFGTGADRVDVTAVALDGSADYGRRLAADRAARRQIGVAVARSPRIVVQTPAGAVELADGLVDSRLSSLLTLIGGSHTLTVVSFDGAGPGAGADIPESDVVISRVDGQPVGRFAPQTAILTALVDAQQPPYRPLSVVSESDDVKISFSQPEPLGLIAGATP